MAAVVNGHGIDRPQHVPFILTTAPNNRPDIHAQHPTSGRPRHHLVAVEDRRGQLRRGVPRDACPGRRVPDPRCGQDPQVSAHSAAALSDRVVSSI